MRSQVVVCLAFAPHPRLTHQFSVARTELRSVEANGRSWWRRMARRHRSPFSADRAEVVVLIVLFAALVVTVGLWLDVLFASR